MGQLEVGYAADAVLVDPRVLEGVEEEEGEGGESSKGSGENGGGRVRSGRSGSGNHSGGGGGGAEVAVALTPVQGAELLYNLLPDVVFVGGRIEAVNNNKGVGSGNGSIVHPGLPDVVKSCAESWGPGVAATAAAFDAGANIVIGTSVDNGVDTTALTRQQQVALALSEAVYLPGRNGSGSYSRSDTSGTMTTNYASSAALWSNTVLSGQLCLPAVNATSSSSGSSSGMWSGLKCACILRGKYCA